METSLNRKCCFVWARNVGELEMRNDRPQRYQKVRFNMNIVPAMSILLDRIPRETDFASNISVYGRANKKFGNWERAKRPRS